MENRPLPAARAFMVTCCLKWDKPPRALVEYEDPRLKATPQPLSRPTWVSPRAADAAGNRAKAIEYYGKLVDLAKECRRPSGRKIREAKSISRSKVTGQQYD